MVKDTKTTGTITEHKQDKNLFFTKKVTVFANNMVKILLSNLATFRILLSIRFTDVNNGSIFIYQPRHIIK